MDRAISKTKFFPDFDRRTGKRCEMRNAFQSRRPGIEPQTEAADCGYVCMSAIMSLKRRPMRVDDIKGVVGQTSRGLTLKQLRDGFRALGVSAEAVVFDAKSQRTYPTPGVILLAHGHYVVTTRSSGKSVEVFDPRFGWSWVPFKRLARQANGLAVIPGDFLTSAASAVEATTHHKKFSQTIAYAGYYLNVLGVGALAAAIVAQLAALSLPLVSKVSVDHLTQAGTGISPALIVGAFFLATGVGSLTTFLTSTINRLVEQRALKSLGGMVFDNFARKPHAWFSSVRSSTLHSKITAVETRFAFTGEVFQAAGTTLVSAIAGLLVLFFISPWLAVPGFLSLGASIAIELSFARRQSSHLSASFDATQARQTFNLEVLPQLPMLSLFGSLKRGRAHHNVVVARVADVEARLQHIRASRAFAVGLVKAAEALVFISIAAVFIGDRAHSLGSFVAVAAYKDLLSQSIARLFQLSQRHRTLEVQRLYTEEFDPTVTSVSGEERELTSGAISLEGVSYAYGELDPLVLHDVKLTVQSGECVVIRGESGSGKSTLAKLIAGFAEASSGEILIDGAPPAHPMSGFAAVFQSDRLLPGSIRDNVAVYRRAIKDAQIYEALDVAELGDFVRQLPMRLNTAVGEAMGGLSGGQKQRLMIARAVLGRPKLLLLDEATASLDVETERRVLQTLRGLGVTLVLISHRPEIWKFADRVIDLFNGRIVDVSAGAQATVPAVTVTV